MLLSVDSVVCYKDDFRLDNSSGPVGSLLVVLLGTHSSVYPTKIKAMFIIFIIICFNIQAALKTLESFSMPSKLILQKEIM